MEQDVVQNTGGVWYDVWAMLKKWVPRLVLAFIILKIIIWMLKKDPLYVGMNIVGFLIALPPAYWIVRKFFRIDYYVFLHSDMEKRIITPYYIPKKLFAEGKWEIEGVKAGFKSMFDEFRDSEVERIIKEVGKLDKKIKEKEGKIKAYNDRILDLEGKKEYFRIKINKLDVIPYDVVLEKGKIKNMLKNTHNNVKNIAKTIKKHRKTKSEISKLYEHIEKTRDEIKDLKAEKNYILQDLAWEGEHGGLVYLADSIDRKEKKVVLSPLHSTSNIELQINHKKFTELKTYIRDLTSKYAKMKIDYEDKVYDAAIDLIEEIEKETYNIDVEKGEEHVRD